VGSEPLGVVVLLHIHQLLAAGDNINGGIVVTTVTQYHQSTMYALQDQIQCQVPIGHGNDGVNGIRITSPHQVSQMLIDDIDGCAAIEFRRLLFDQI
jgi:hypothetical protein